MPDKHGRLLRDDYPKIAKEAAEKYASRFALNVTENSYWVEQWPSLHTLTIYDRPLRNGLYYEYGLADNRKNVVMQVTASIHMDTSSECIAEMLLDRVDPRCTCAHRESEHAEPNNDNPLGRAERRPCFECDIDRPSCMDFQENP